MLDRITAYKLLSSDSEYGTKAITSERSNETCGLAEGIPFHDRDLLHPTAVKLQCNGRSTHYR
jgi:hypothetical protein